jgi:hypothetical protein
MAKGKTKGKRGGIRPGAGNPYKWKHRETKPVRLPIALIPKILEIAQLIDGQEYIDRVQHEFDDEEASQNITTVTTLHSFPILGVAMMPSLRRLKTFVKK